MKRELLKWLVCPACVNAFRLEAVGAEDTEVIEGRLTCKGCGASYPILRGIPRILPATMIEEQQRTAGAFGWEWNRFSRLLGLDLYTEQFLDWIAPLSAETVRGKLVLDAGCGMGRFSAVCSHLGAREVVAVDISRAVEAAWENTKHLSNVHVVQASIYDLPLRREVGDFEFVFSIGVLHHLPQPRAGFCSLARHLKPGGTLAAWVYGYENNEWVVRYINPIRLWITSRLPHRVLYILSMLIALPLQLMLKLVYAPTERVRALGFLKRLLPYKYFFWLSRFGFRHTHNVVFDHLVAPKADYLKHEEFAEWFDGAGLIDKTITARNENSWRGHGRKPGVAAS
ncbi:MAG: methyltransferase domain-containing protein [Verrucomicrobia bacterium]|nr:methyltransferase domain-containing protein [Verrucomicrobiota bacterium]